MSYSNYVSEVGSPYFNLDPVTKGRDDPVFQDGTSIETNDVFQTTHEMTNKNKNPSRKIANPGKYIPKSTFFAKEKKHLTSHHNDIFGSDNEKVSSQGVNSRQRRRNARAQQSHGHADQGLNGKKKFVRSEKMDKEAYKLYK